MPKKSFTHDVVTMGAAVRDIFLWLAPQDIEIIKNPRLDPTRERLLCLEYGAKLAAQRSAFSLGGGALNSAVTFSRLGFNTAAAVSLGCDDNADAIAADMKREKVGTSLVSYHSTRPTGFSVLLVAGAEREHVAIVERGANDLLDLPAKAAASKSHWYYTTTLHGQAWQKVLEKIAAAAVAKKSSWAWNPGAEQLERGLGGLGRWLKHCTVFSVNRDEALQLVGADGSDRRHDIKHLLTAILHWGVKIALITDGPVGAYCSDGKQIYHVSADEKLKVVESTGAGDAFGSGFVSGLILTKNQNIPYALALGMANAESVLGQVGAQEGILRKGEMDKAIRRVKHRIRKIK